MNFTDMVNEAIRKGVFRYTEVLACYLVIAEAGGIYHYFDKADGAYIMSKND
jgi:hypothetical protein